jgi:hypothetical protein
MGSIRYQLKHLKFNLLDFRYMTLLLMTRQTSPFPLSQKSPFQIFHSLCLLPVALLAIPQRVLVSGFHLLTPMYNCMQT